MKHEITRSEDIGYIAAQCSCGWSGSVDKSPAKYSYLTAEKYLNRKIAGHLGGSKAARNRCTAANEKG